MPQAVILERKAALARDLRPMSAGERHRPTGPSATERKASRGDTPATMPKPDPLSYRDGGPRLASFSESTHARSGPRPWLVPGSRPIASPGNALPRAGPGDERGCAHDGR